MNLIVKYSLFSLKTMIILLLAGSIIYYFIVRVIILQQLDKELEATGQEITTYIKENNSLPAIAAYKNPQVVFEPAVKGTITGKAISTNKRNNARNRNEHVRQLALPVTVNGRLHQVVIFKSQVEAENLIYRTVLATTGIFLMLLILTAIINAYFLYKLWNPFYATLKLSLKEFNLVTRNEVYLPANAIQDFSNLNRFFEDMAMRVTQEYENLRAFADNAFHEMQTPLTIIHSRLASIIQSSDKAQVDKLRVIYDITGRLIEHNERLLLIAKIDNRQYSDTELINMRSLVESRLNQFDKSIKDKQLTLTHNLQDLSFLMSKELAEILVDNLLSNAIRHNYNGGTITCTLTKWKLAISNTGPALTFDQADLFKKFPKTLHSDGLGLGLAVVKKICDSNGLSVVYVYADEIHTFNVLF